MRFCIIGCGSIGLLLAAWLASSGAEVVLFCRRLNQVQLINSSGVRVAAGGGEEVARVRAYLSSSPPQLGCDVCIVAVKAYDTEAVIPTIERSLKPNGVVVSAQNGIGPLELLEKQFGPQNVAAAVLYVGALRLADNLVTHTGGRRIVLGSHTTRPRSLLEELAEALRAAEVEATVVDNIDAWRWDKLVVNAAINPVTAITSAPNRVIIESEYARRLALELAREAHQVARSLGVNPPRSYEEAVLATAAATSANKSSMLQDLEAGRKTEIDYINGAVVRIGREKGVPTPYNEAVYLAVKALEDVLARKP